MSRAGSLDVVGKLATLTGRIGLPVEHRVRLDLTFEWMRRYERAGVAIPAHWIAEALDIAIAGLEARRVSAEKR